MYDRYEFEPEVQEKIEEFERLAASYEAQIERDWQPKKPPYATKEKASDPYTARREIFESCRKTTPNGASYISLGEYYKKLNEM